MKCLDIPELKLVSTCAYRYSFSEAFKLVMVRVKVSEGMLEGEVVENEFGGQFCSFKGIPYAESPVGNLRFKAPQPKKPWNGVRSAKQHGSSCIQGYDLLTTTIIGAEDCLFLNVYTPEINPGILLPVMFWIHGGGFRLGSGNDDFYGPQFLIKHGVVLVTINYRLEALGFLSLDTEEIPGNAGMKDQVAALRWVKKNVKSFGGNPDNITIFGESAGGASTSYHLVSPMSKGLFKQAIVQSGALTCTWAQTFEPRERALKLAKQLGCNSEDDKELAKFFRSVPAENLVGLDLPVTQSTKLYELSFAVVSEKKFGDSERFFYGDQVEVLRNGLHEGVKVMTGYTQDESIMAFGLNTNISFEDYISRANEFKEFFVPKPIQLNCSIKDQMEVGRKMKEFYFKKDIVSKENFDKLMAFINWDMFIHGGLLLAKLISDKTIVYLYKVTCFSDRNVIMHGLGVSEMPGASELFRDKKIVSHADELMYLFNASPENFNGDLDSETYAHIERMTTIWTNFAKFGNPTPDASLGVKWSPFTLEKKAFMELGNQLVAGNAHDAEDDDFWDAIFKEYLPSYTAQ